MKIFLPEGGREGQSKMKLIHTKKTRTGKGKETRSKVTSGVGGPPKR